MHGRIGLTCGLLAGALMAATAGAAKGNADVTQTFGVVVDAAGTGSTDLSRPLSIGEPGSPASLKDAGATQNEAGPGDRGRPIATLPEPVTMGFLAAGTILVAVNRRRGARLRNGRVGG
jgi:hypothetical protein